MRKRSFFGLGLCRAVLFCLCIATAAVSLGLALRATPSLREKPGSKPSSHSVHPLLLAENSGKPKNSSPYEINFGADPNTPFRVHAELERWARNHNLLLVSDSPMRNLQDGLARVIQPGGLRFSLKMPEGVGRAWLYLDLVSYRPLGSYQFSQVHWLDIYSNGILLKILYQGGGSFLKTPYRLPIDREYARDGIVRIELRPSPGDSSWAIWDAFISKYKE